MSFRYMQQLTENLFHQFERQLRPCPGNARVNDTSRSWYVKSGHTPEEMTYCEECFEKYISFMEKPFYTRYTGLPFCNCDYNKYYRHADLRSNGINVSIINQNTGLEFDKLHDSHANSNNVMHMTLPTNSHYSIVINNESHDYDNNVYLEFVSGKVGNKYIIMNGGKKIYYSKKIKIDGYATGSNESFLFISLSDKDKMNGHLISHENESNIIKLKLRKYRRMPSAQTSLYLNNSPFLYRMVNELSGGATVSGGRYVDNVDTVATNDNFEQIGGDIDFTIQLLCNQSDVEKYNSNNKYFNRTTNKNIDRKVLLERKIDDAKSKIHDLNEQIFHYQQEINDIDKEMRHNGFLYKF